MGKVEEFNMENDIIITIKKEPSENILRGKKTYEFRKYIPKTGIKRIWVYTGMPVGKMEYMMEIDKIINSEILSLIMGLKKVYMHII